MSLGGNLKDIAIVDIIQLVNSTRKSGSIHVKNRSRGEGKLVFDIGYIVSANHPSDKVHVGTILVEMNAITAEDLEEALEEQKQAGDDRKPLIAILVEKGKLKKEDAFKGLERLIELTVVEFVSWSTGSFAMNVAEIEAADEYQYCPENLGEEVCMDSQMVLMEALRIFDEKLRDGEIEMTVEEEGEEEEPYVEEEDASSASISADLLGLDNLDDLDEKPPSAFKGLEAFDPADINRQIIDNTIENISEEERAQLLSYLSIFSGGGKDGDPRKNEHSHTVIIFSQDELAKHTLMTVLKNEGVFVMDAGDGDELKKKISQCVSKQIVPLVVFDSPELAVDDDFEKELFSLRKEVKVKLPNICTIQLSSPGDYEFYLQSFADGVRTVFPKPTKTRGKENYVKDFIKFLTSFQSYIVSIFKEQES